MGERLPTHSSIIYRGSFERTHPLHNGFLLGALNPLTLNVCSPCYQQMKMKAKTIHLNIDFPSIFTESRNKHEERNACGILLNFSYFNNSPQATVVLWEKEKTIANLVAFFFLFFGQ